MSSKILINASHHEEVRVAIVDNNKLAEYDHDRLDNVNKKGCIYKGCVSRIEPSLNAAFIDYGSSRHGFLPVSEITQQLYPKGVAGSSKPAIQDILTEGQQLIVQVDKEERGSKGAALTTNISLAGCYIVLMPMTSDAGGISRQIEGDEREHLVRLMNQMDISDKFSIIVRTASIGRTLEELLWDYNVLKSQWEAIVQYAQDFSTPVLLHKDGFLLSRVIRDYLRPEVESVIIDDQSVYDEVLKLVQHIRPDFLSKVKMYENVKNEPLFAHYGIEADIESIFNPEVILGNGSTLVIDHREALTSIDINSARATSNADIETTAFNTNLNAAVEIARQIRLRNIGGQIVIDFIDMSSSDHCRQVEQAFKEALGKDKARIQLGKISKFGLLEMSRQRMKTSLDELQLTKCEACHGRGMHRRPRSVALSILRLLEQECLNKKDTQFEIKVHPRIAEFLYNNYRQHLCKIESNCQVKIVLNCQLDMSIGDYDIVVTPKASIGKTIRNYIPEEQEVEQEYKGQVATGVLPNAQSMIPNPKGETFFKKLWKFFFGVPEKSKNDKNHPRQHHHRGEKRNYHDKNNPQAQSQPHKGQQRRRPSGPHHNKKPVNEVAPAPAAPPQAPVVNNNQNPTTAPAAQPQKQSPRRRSGGNRRPQQQNQNNNNNNETN